MPEIIFTKDSERIKKKQRFFKYLTFPYPFGIIIYSTSSGRKERILKKGYIVIDQSLCKGCGLCMDVCPKNLITTAQELNIKGYYPAEFTGGDGENPQGCTGCALCALVCPDIAIEVYRE